MRSKILTKIDRRNILYRDDTGVLHECKGYRSRKCRRCFIPCAISMRPAREYTPSIAAML